MVVLHRSHARSQIDWTLIRDLAIYGILPFYYPQILHKQLMIFFSNAFLSTVIQQISCQSGYLSLVMFSADVILFPEGTFSLKVSIKSLQLLFIDGNDWYSPQAIMMDSPFFRELRMK